MERIKRQQIFVKCLLDQSFDFNAFRSEEIDISNIEALNELKAVNASYRFSISDDNVAITIQDKKVLMQRSVFDQLSKNYFRPIKRNIIA